ncbi:hypothetical protein GCM10010123_38370 [Pilimelia anulata]|uniref:Double-GTPase 2 domain-containing protein n=1 Tax=Pilimelia anulata TaxID=53371 RepID=A0A8J3BCD3_9ACTN|nr:hypothetical protein [Pilimelia anulata]GGK04749.1 hypothetical protein GCM10010123_38370 [Pilimelia anulata]
MPLSSSALLDSFGQERLWITIAVVVVVAAVTYRWIAASGRSTIPPIRIFLFGDSGAGKTMLLAALYARWARGRGQDGVRLFADNAVTDRRVRELIRAVDGGADRLPRATRTGDVHRTSFRLQVREDADVHETFRLDFVDYAGEHVREMLDGRDEYLPFVREELARADVVIGLLDGDRLAAAMGGRPPSGFGTDLAALLDLVEQHNPKAGHLIITKWDLVDPRHAGAGRLAEVVRYLRRYESFKTFWRPHNGRVHRIIPVSAFGFNGYFDPPATPGATRAAGVEWEPFLGESPVACAVLDLLDVEVARYRAAATNSRTPTKLPPLLAALMRAAALVGGLLPFGFTPPPPDEVAKLIDDLRNVPRPRGEGSRKARMRKLLGRLTTVERRLTKRFPNSVAAQRP